jgi:hypothetical protein
MKLRLHAIILVATATLALALAVPAIGYAATDVTPPITTDNTNALWHNTDVSVTLTATDSESGPAMTYYSIDGLTPPVAGGMLSDPNTLISTFVIPATADHLNDGIHTISYWSTDNSNNVEVAKSAVVNIDTQAPVTRVSGADAKWHRKPVTLTLVAQDLGLAGVKQTQVKIDGRAWTTATTAKVLASANHTWDGIHTVYFCSTDNAGNIEVTKSCKVMIDTVGPVCIASAASRAIAGTKATLRYRVNDARSATANVTILVKSAAGKTVKTVKLANRRTGRTLTTSFVCKFAAGTYHYYVDATDLAGNPQAKAGKNTLTVRPRIFSSLRASISDTSPAQYSDVSAYATAKDQLGHAIAGVKVTFTWHYKTTTPSETHATGSSGMATCTRDISRASKKYRVVITMTATFGGVTKTTSTGFTPS